MIQAFEGNCGGQMDILYTDEQVRAAIARHRANVRAACEIVIEENDPDDWLAVEGAKATLAELDRMERRSMQG
ncbi:hypothetical protein [Mesorhizobium sp. BR-1-1-10]|uniref:hypothetical protein n=1 Tax=Mesorhizobium sp. BR-1-1-10 TaxID=2876660 RepID=UPI001CD18342|nr:hypothetical protein [Mesorhizobium sp. BR-1-1-10]MBZ9975963.1 hypothetical protein [Mesorhizobium sp. BR-1-1-10]